jgi:hypothetical protein
MTAQYSSAAAPRQAMPEGGKGLPDPADRRNFPSVFFAAGAARKNVALGRLKPCL